MFLFLLGFFSNRKAAGSVHPLGRSSDEDLYRRFAEGDERAFSLLLDRHGDNVLGYLTRFFGDREMATDLTQDVFLRVISAAPEFRGGASFRTFLYRIVRNLCIDVMRSRRARPDAGAVSLDGDCEDDSRPLSEVVPGVSPQGPDRTFSGELSIAVRAGLAKLPAEQREVFLMREVEGLKFCDIADVLGINENTVKSRMHYALTSLRQALAQFRDGDAG
ncbi:MAG: sigma-70 family RNA polymerase sigma factor [Deltaproteobacteria bacterium]|nr:sigma-70 family RNA polymerase sigma factor [Deltaproteobacteria bacterium]